MTVRCLLVPDGLTELPADARDDSVLWSNLQNAEASSNSPVGTMREVERRVFRERIELRLDGTLDDHSTTTLDNITAAIVNNLSGVKVHPDGWHEVTEA